MFELINGSFGRAKRLASGISPVWVSWQYSAEEWEEFDKRERKHSKSTLMNAAKVNVGLVLVLSAVAFIVNLVSTPFRGIGLLAVLFTILMLTIGTIGFADLYLTARSQHEARQRGPHEVYIIPVGVYVAKRYIPLISPQLSLLRVYIRSQDTSVLRFLVSRFAGRSSQEYEVWVPIPKGREAEAEQIAVKFQQEVVRSR